jgi:hypothetical protein
MHIIRTAVYFSSGRSLLPCVGHFNMSSGKAIIFQKQGRHTLAASIAHMLKCCFKEKSSTRVRRRYHSWLTCRLERNTRTRFVEFRPNSCHVLGIPQRQLPRQVSVVRESNAFCSISALLLPVLLENCNQSWLLERDAVCFGTNLAKCQRKLKNRASVNIKGKAIPLQAWAGPEGSRRLRVPGGWGFQEVEGSRRLRIPGGWGFQEVDAPRF